jgi:cyanate lyase
VVWATAALLGQHPFSAPDAATVVTLLALPQEALPILTAVPMRGQPTTVPTDPTMYRFYEALQVYGPAIKELIHEQFGDGIMSAINFGLTVERREHPGGDRVVVTFDGKFLPYDWAPD